MPSAVVTYEIHQIVRRIIDRGIVDETLRPGITPHDIIIFGAMLAQPHPTDPYWDTTCRRLLRTYLRGLRPTP
jgi:hypothetical protein